MPPLGGTRRTHQRSISHVPVSAFPKDLTTDTCQPPSQSYLATTLENTRLLRGVEGFGPSESPVYRSQGTEWRTGALVFALLGMPFHLSGVYNSRDHRSYGPMKWFRWNDFKRQLCKSPFYKGGNQSSEHLSSSFLHSVKWLMYSVAGIVLGDWDREGNWPHKAHSPALQKGWAFT